MRKLCTVAVIPSKRPCPATALRSNQSLQHGGGRRVVLVPDGDGSNPRFRRRGGESVQRRRIHDEDEHHSDQRVDRMESRGHRLVGAPAGELLLVARVREESGRGAQDEDEDGADEDQRRGSRCETLRFQQRAFRGADEVVRARLEGIRDAVARAARRFSLLGELRRLLAQLARLRDLARAQIPPEPAPELHQGNQLEDHEEPEETPDASRGRPERTAEGCRPIEGPDSLPRSTGYG